ncbi:hypothetical protein KEM54_001810 [Ascosphaera aggregata]|nr:hypothetical protein KEM54_001810 [Ascosphaera aggregata]
MAKMFVQQHRGEEWFKEKYIKDMREPIRKKLTEYRKNHALKQWQEDLANGLFDDFTLEGIYRSESDGAGGVIEKEEGEATAVGETLGVLDLVPVKGGDLRDDSALHAPALLIKTLAPNVSREKIEEFCRECLGEEKGGFEWLSLSDPNPAKRFHRMGWVMLKLDPNAGHEGNGIDRSDDRFDIVEEGEGDVEKEKDKKSKESSALATAENALPYVNEKSIRDPLRGDFTAHVGVHFPPPNPRKKALWDLFSAPARIERDLELAKRITRKFDAEMGDGLDSVRTIEEKVDSLSREGRLLPPVTSTPGSKSTKQQKANVRENDDDEEPFEEQADMIPVLNEGVEKGEGEVGDDDEVDSPTLLAQKKELDLLVEYLRRVYNFCLFCVFEADSVHELVRKCPGGHLRRPRSGLSKLALEAAKASARGQPFPLDISKVGSDTGKSLSEDVEEGEEGEEKEDRSKNNRRTNKKFTNRSQYQLNRAYNWVRTYEDKIFQVLEPENADLTRLGGQPMQAGLDIELKKYIKQEDENRYRCKVPECTKLFKAEHFWRKHVEKRHSEWLKELTDELELINAYVLDPGHIVLGKDATGPANGYYGPGMGMGMNMSMSANSMKGYNLGNTSMLGAGAAASGSNHHMFSMHNGAGVHSFPGPWPMTVPDSSSRLAPHHGPGAIRRGGGAGGYGRYNNRYTPYDRRGPGSSTSGGGSVPYNVPSGRMYPPGSSLHSRGTVAARAYPPTGFGGVSSNAGGGVVGSSSLGSGVVGAGSVNAMMGMAPGAGGGPSLAIGGGNAMAGVGGPGPREAVQGRSLKSYEDLDAVGGEGGVLVRFVRRRKNLAPRTSPQRMQIITSKRSLYRNFRQAGFIVQNLLQ